MIAAEIERLLRQLVREEVRSALEQLAGSMAPTRLVTVQEYAAARSLHVSTVRTAICGGRLTATRIGRAVRVPAGAEIAPPTTARSTVRSANPRKTATARAATTLGLVGGR